MWLSSKLIMTRYEGLAGPLWGMVWIYILFIVNFPHASKWIAEQDLCWFFLRLSPLFNEHVQFAVCAVSPCWFSVMLLNWKWVPCELLRAFCMMDTCCFFERNAWKRRIRVVWFLGLAAVPPFASGWDLWITQRCFPRLLTITSFK